MQSRFSPLDALRAIAALLVVWQHLSEAFVRLPGVAALGTTLHVIALQVDFGRIGVVCFFLISGFIIPSSLKGGDPHAIRHFGIKRLMRLYPAYWVSIIAAVGAHLLWSQGHVFGASTIAANATMLQTFFGEPHIQGLYWTLQIELIFYITCALLFMAKVLHQPRSLLVVCVAFLVMFGVSQVVFKKVPQWTPPKELAYAPFLMSIMFLGSLYRKAFDADWRSKSINAMAAAGTLACFSIPLLVLLAYLGANLKLTDGPLRFGVSHLSGLLIFGLGLLYLRRPPRLLVWMGQISYSLYLFHPVAMILVLAGSEHFGIFGWHLSVYMLVGGLLSLLIAQLGYKLVEAPFNQWGHRLSQARS